MALAKAILNDWIRVKIGKEKSQYAPNVTFLGTAGK